jgi:hypothetical protein
VDNLHKLKRVPSIGFWFTRQVGTVSNCLEIKRLVERV